MTFYKLAKYFQKLESTSSRTQMMQILADLYRHVEVENAGYITYLLQGRVVPLYQPLEFGVANKMMIKAVSLATNLPIVQVLAMFKYTGDLGDTVEKLKAQSAKLKTTGQKFKVKSGSKRLQINEVYEDLFKLAKTQGKGSQEIKLAMLSGLLGQADPLSAKYITRITLGKLRLGFSDMTILDALSWMIVGDKSKRKEIETAYNVRPDLGFIAETIKKKGVKSLAQIKPSCGTPILMARANRLNSPEEILAKIGKCAVEYKYDGLRLQVHYERELKTQNKIPIQVRSSHLAKSDLDDKSALKSLADSSNKKSLIKMFSRNLEDVTSMFPDITKAVKQQVNADSVIFEGEVVSYNPQTGASVPFQTTMQRKRKYDIAQKAQEIPVKLFAFELLYLNGQNLINQTYSQRKNALKKILASGEVIKYAQEQIVDNTAQMDELFQETIELNFEGVIAKKITGTYQAGVRGWNWIKYKRAMSKKLADTFDVVIMGYTKGEGKRSDFGLGQFLTGVRDEKTDQLVTITKVGTGLTDDQFRQLKKNMIKLETKTKPKQYQVDKLLYPDVWLVPQLVVEVGCDEITRSQVHTAGRVMTASKSGKAEKVKESGYALRFPKLIRFREDKRVADITTVEEVKQMYKLQTKSQSAKRKS